MKDPKAHVEKLEKEIARCQAAIQEANRELPTLGAKLVEARAAMKEDERKRNQVRLADLRVSLREQLHELDAAGWTPAGEIRVFELFSQLRQIGCSGQSWEALNLYVEKLKQPSTSGRLKRQWSGLLDWVREAA
jgi:predicted RNase H-like nuclease (RuvC/YqgF family)